MRRGTLLSLTALSASAAALFAVGQAAAQQFNVVSIDGNSSGTVMTNGGGNQVMENMLQNDARSPRVFFGTKQRDEFGVDCFQDGPQTRERGQTRGWVAFQGTSGRLELTYRAYAMVARSTPPECCVAWNNLAQSESTMTVTFEVTGLPDGTPVQLRWGHRVGASQTTDDEGANEDTTRGVVDIDVAGVDVSDFSLNDPDFSQGGKRYNIDGETDGGCIDVVAGQQFTVTLSVEALANHLDPGRASAFCPLGRRDDDCSQIRGGLALELEEGDCDPNGGGGGPPPPNNPPDMPDPDLPPDPDDPDRVVAPELLFSLDFGSDTELSETAMPVTAPPFDVGDAYAQSQPFPGAPFNGVFDDLGGFDLGAPTSPDVIGAAPAPPLAPLGGGAPIDPLGFLDVDGFDSLSVDLRQFIDPAAPLDSLIPVDAIGQESIYTAHVPVVSFDDDEAPNYVTPSWPANENVGPTQAVFGAAANEDEVLEAAVTILAPLPTAWAFGLGLSETQVHTALGPNPDPGLDPFAPDDDVDGLDARPSDPTIEFPFFYYTVDHEATGERPADPPAAADRPGVVYVSPDDGVTPGAPLIAPDIHLGLPSTVDLDAMEFAWIPAAPDFELALALLFSVDEDDAATTDDESGGLDPTDVYASHLDGAHFLYAEPLQSFDIDALALSWDSVRGADLFPPLTAPCPGDLNNSGMVDGADLGLVLLAWSPVAGSAVGSPADLNGDGQVDGADLGLLLLAWGACL